MFDTSMGVKAIESMQLKEVPFDQWAAPISAATQKTTSFWCTPDVYKIVMKDFGSLKLKTEGVVSLKTIRKEKGTPFRTAGSEEYNSVMCEMLAHVARQLQMGTPGTKGGGTQSSLHWGPVPALNGDSMLRGNAVPLCITPGTQGGDPGTQGSGTEDSVPLCTTPGTQGGAPGTQGGGAEDSVPLCTNPGNQSGATMATGKSTQYPADQGSTENHSRLHGAPNSSG